MVYRLGKAEIAVIRLGSCILVALKDRSISRGISCMYGKHGKKAPNGYYYYEDWQRKNDIADVTKWKPSIHAERSGTYLVKVTDVRVERLQDITPKDAENEGVGNLFYEDIGYSEKNYGTEVDPEYGIAKEQFAWLWNQPSRNPTLTATDGMRIRGCRVIEFERCEKPE